MTDGDGLLARLDLRLDATEVRAVMAEDPMLASLVENSLRRARELFECRYSLEAHVWLAGVTAIVERCRTERLAAKASHDERISTLVEALGGGRPAQDFGGLLSRAAALQPDATGALLDVIESALTLDGVP